MEDGVSRSGEQRGRDERWVALRRCERQRRKRQQRKPGGKDALRAVPIHRESRRRLADAGHDEEPGGQRARLGEAEVELRHQPGEQRGNDQVEEVRSSVGEADERHHLEVAGAHRRGHAEGRLVHRSGTTGFKGRSLTESWKTSGRA